MKEPGQIAADAYLDAIGAMDLWLNLRKSQQLAWAAAEAAVRAAALDDAAKILDGMADEAEADHERSELIRYYRDKAATIRALSPSPAAPD